MRFKLIILNIIFLFLIFSVYPEVIVLKSGKTINGKIVEKTDRYIKVDINGIIITYFLEEIESIDNKPVFAQNKNFKESLTKYQKRTKRYL